ncbi:hypothetical protein AALB_3685 [Agarivorans albus MKT 106]|uniref:Uncharacterized protein n=2 Tax=Agarivorans albus TaxID=182262 RepID=R9PQL7_AGAAL|nr:hypothetical protein AALB_3685 [Agarivorans albus MKT 106]
MTYIEINEFCEDQRQLSEEENILFNMNLTFDFSTCVESAKEDSTKIAQEAWTMVKQSGISAVESVDETIEPSRRELIKAFEAIDQFFN